MLSFSSLSPPASTVHPLASVCPTSVELPKLSMLITQQQKRGLNFTAKGFQVVRPIPVRTDVTVRGAKSTPHGHVAPSLASPALFLTQPKIANNPPLVAAEQERLSASPLPSGRSSPFKRKFLQMQPLYPIMHSMGGYPLETSAMSKRTCIRSDDGLNTQASYGLLSRMPRQGIVNPNIISHQPQQPQPQYMRPAKAQSPHTAFNPLGLHQLPTHLGISVWDAVLTTCNFPKDMCFNENSASPAVSFYPNKVRSKIEDATYTVGADVTVGLKHDQRSDDEGVNALIQAAQRGSMLLPPKAYLPISNDKIFKCPTTGVSKEARSLSGSSHQVTESVVSLNDSFNALSRRSIMSCASLPSIVRKDEIAIAKSSLSHQSFTSSMISTEKMRTTQRVLKRSDYSQHGTVRSGRWSMEEENYAKAMIEAFKAGYLPLHGNVSLRKFLSEILVCHPMRISKKFVGYVRKYHWYRAAAGKCDPEVKAQALQQLSRLEHDFWTSQQSSEWLSGLRCDG